MRDKKDIKYKIILCIIIAVNLASIIYCFATKKEGWHSDEVWSYGYANSYYKMQLYQDKDGNLTNLNEWVDSKVLNDYIEVNDGEKFAFDSVYDNQIQDLSPPLHSMILHAICSFFPNTFSWWYSFVINIVSFIVCMIFLYKTAVVLKNEEMGLICCVLYGVSLAARDTYVYLRMYAMCTAMTMVLIYNVCTYIEKGKGAKIVDKNLMAIFIVSFLMFFTHYYMISLVGIVTACVCVICLFRKQIKQAFIYGALQLASLLISFVVFPSVVRIFLSHQENVNATVSSSMDYQFPAKMKVMANFILYKLYGIHISVFMDFIWLKTGIFAIVAICIVLLPLAIFLRKTSFINNGKEKIRMIIKKIGWWIRNINKAYFMIIVAIIGQVLVVALTSQVYNMGWDEGRYIMYLYPLVTIVVVSCIYTIVKKIRNTMLENIIICLFVVGVVCVNIYYRNTDDRYYYKQYTDGIELKNVISGKDCIYLTNSDWAIVYMTPILRYSHQYFQTSKDDYTRYSDEYLKKNKNNIVILIDTTDLAVKRGLKNYTENSEELIEEIEKKYQDIFKYYENLFTQEKLEYVSSQNVFGRQIEAYIFE